MMLYDLVCAVRGWDLWVTCAREVHSKVESYTMFFFTRHTVGLLGICLGDGVAV